jgi:diguanylate cyclase (GGDEF)-like protein/PAS domain S-box-containing protein
VSHNKELSSDYLARLLLLQNIGALLPDHDLYEIVCQGLQDFPGVESAVWESKVQPDSIDSNSVVLSIKYADSFFGDILLHLSERSEITPYIPYLQNFATMMAVILETKRRERSVTFEQESFFELVPDLMCTANDQGYFTKLSYSWEKVLGWTREELCTMPFRELIHPDDLDETDEALDNLSNGQQLYGFVNRYRDKLGDYRWMQWAASTDSNGVIYATARDVTKQRMDAERIRELAYQDTLTGLANRTYLQNAVIHAISVAERTGRRMAVLFIDLDNFKSINDSLGHDIGDQVLAIEADRLRRSVRKADIVARMGGDEFVIFVENVRDNSDITHLADKVCKVLSIPIEVNGNLLHVTSSIGISTYPDDGKDRVTLLKSADVAMYTAKENGKNAFCYFSPKVMEKANRRLDIEMALRKAIELEQFEVYYQPRICLKDHMLSGAEALIRWNHPEKGMILPNEFISIAEETGLINQIGRFVIDDVVRQIALWQQKHAKVVPIAINISALQFNEGNIEDQVLRSCLAYDVLPETLELELTESVVMSNPEQARLTLKALRKLGVRIAIDDFGTGHSSLAYLKKLPLDILKIDQSFIQELNTSSDDKAIVQTIVALAKVLDMELVAEGVESVSHEKLLINFQCEHAQGFLYAKPMVADQFFELMRKGLTQKSTIFH